MYKAVTNELLIIAISFESKSHIITDIIDWKSDKVQMILWSNDGDYANTTTTTNVKWKMFASHAFATFVDGCNLDIFALF